MTQFIIHVLCDLNDNEDWVMVYDLSCSVRLFCEPLLHNLDYAQNKFCDLGYRVSLFDSLCDLISV